MREEKKERLERIRQMYEEGMSVTNMAKELGCGISTASECLRELGIKEKKIKENTIKAQEMYKEGKTTTQISCELKVSITFVRNALKKCGLGTRDVFHPEKDLINESTIFAEDRLANLVLEKVMIDGKMYEDITPIFSPR